MSGIELAAMAITGGIDAAGAYEKTELAEEQESYNEARIRNEQVQLRLQDTQNAIQRADQLRQVIATTTVQEAYRGLGASSGSVRGIFEQDFKKYDEDEAAANLNLQSKLTNLNISEIAGKMSEHAQIADAWLGFAKDTAQIGMSAYEFSNFKAPGSSIGNEESGGLKSYYDATRPYLYVKKNPFDINAGEV